MLDKFSLEGKVALVTGSKRGLGKAMALGLAQAGADIIGVSVSMEESGSDLEKEVKALGRKCKCYRCDFSDRKATYDFIAKVKAEFPVVDILVSNAGTIERKPAVEHTDEMWDKVIEVNLNSHFVMAREFGKDMVARGSGKIVMTASLLSFQGGITVPGYSAAKGGIAQLTKALANEWASKGVNVNAIAPGYIATDLAAALRADPVRNPAIVARIPAGNWGDPTDLQGAVVFLCSEAASYVHGIVLPVDGAWLAR
ncbi:MAG: SDR family oxidoreductase [Dehalococcoidia bacterium]|nr:SDR family oxidoreductase [Dehalococcoidia bacterium]